MFPDFLKKVFAKRAPAKPIAEVENEMSRQIKRGDPLEAISRGIGQGWGDEGPKSLEDVRLKTVADFPLYIPPDIPKYVADENGVKKEYPTADAALKNFKVGDDAAGCVRPDRFASSAFAGVPEPIQNWYLSQSFIGFQACAILAQHWLVDKACTQSGEDAVRHGWQLKADSGDKVEDEDLAEINDADIKMEVAQNLVEMHRFMNIFGIRIVIFVVESPDEDYYEKPFNPDGIEPGSYKGMSQVDPYWTMPVMTSASTNDPSNIHFYDPEYWQINGVKYHRSHLFVLRGPQPADILKPTYIFGGIPLTQRIYERVYAAERTANEAPLLALNKRTTAIHVDLDKALANEPKFLEKILFWVKFRDNHAVKVLGKEETIEQFDTSLADFDSVIMNQFQLVAAIAKTPATKILGTSPKGFSSTGEFETVSYHEELESIEKRLEPALDRHYLCLMKSMGKNIGLKISWNPVDSVSTEKQAELNSKKAATGQILVAGGVISPDEERQRIKDDKDSGYNRLQDSDANSEPGMSPENLAALEKAGAEKDKGEAAQGTAGAKQLVAGAHVNSAPQAGAEKPSKTLPDQEKQDVATPDSKPDAVDLLSSLLDRLTSLEEYLIPEGKEIQPDEFNQRTTKPGVVGIVKPSVRGVRDVVQAMDPSKLPKMKIGGMVISVENPRNTIRKGESVDGPWQQTMPHHYGFIRGTKGADGEEIDCFIGPNPRSQRAFVINQKDGNSGEFDEHKCMLGFDSPEDAKQGYINSFGHGWDGFDEMHEMSIEDLKSWASGSDLTTPFKPV